jgi:hypothetical protein
MSWPQGTSSPLQTEVPLWGRACVTSAQSHDTDAIRRFGLVLCEYGLTLRTGSGYRGIEQRSTQSDYGSNW